MTTRPRRRLLEERIEWLDGFPHRMTIGALLKALRVITQHQLRELPAKETEAERLLREDR